jgi:nicotinate-nucleotide adenylyltransferase
VSESSSTVGGGPTIALFGGSFDRTYHTLVHLIAAHPAVRFRLLVGEDILRERDAWHRWDDVVAMAPPIVVGRTDAGPPTGINDREPPGPSSRFGSRSQVVSVDGAGGDEIGGPVVKLPAISSTEVRERIRRGEGVETLLPGVVMDYIAERGLYR